MLNLVPAAAAGGVVGQAGVERHHGAVAVVDVQHAEVGAVQDGRRAAGRVVARDAQGRVAAVGRLLAAQPERVPDRQVPARRRRTVRVQCGLGV